MSPGKRPRVDPGTMAVLWGAFVSIAEESGAVIERTAYSPIIREAADFSSAIFDHRGRMIGQGAHAVGHLGSMNLAVREVLRIYSSPGLHPGDVVLFNDPAIGAGHLPDLYLIAPVFWKDQLVGYVANTAHHVDVGGVAPGSQAMAGVEELIQEGLRLPPILLYKGGEAIQDIFAIIEANTRMPKYVRRDLEAQLVGLRSSERRLRELFDVYDIDVIHACIDAILDWSEQEMRAGIAALPDGRYEAEDYVDGWGPDTEPVKVRVAVEIASSSARIDFEGTSRQVPTAMNSYYNYTYSYSFFTLKSIVGSSIPQNEGCLRPITIVAPEGSVLNPRFGAPCAGRAVMNGPIFEIIMQALAPAIPDRAVAPGARVFNLSFGGTDPRTEKRFILYKILLGNFGGRATGDAPDGLTSLVNHANTPIEIIEAGYPLRVEHFGFIADSVGSGKFRGACPIRCDIRILVDDVIFTNGSDRHRFPPRGLLGGGSGTVARTILNPGPNEVLLDSKGTYRLKRGDLLRLDPAGGAGFGPPAERTIEAIEKDIQDGYLSRDKAEEQYGVTNRLPSEGILRCCD